MNVLVSPFKVMNDSFVSKFLLDNENVLEEINYSFFDVKVVEFCYHSLLVFQVLLVLVY